MKAPGIASLSALALALLLRVDDASGALPPTNPQLLKLNAKAIRPAKLATQSAAVTFPQYNFTQPLDHFTETGFTWQQRYWVSDRHYKPGGPVIVFEAGEGPGDERMPILDTGIVNILANATNGLGIVLEHRYYGSLSSCTTCTTCRLQSSDLPRGLCREIRPGSQLHHRFFEVRTSLPQPA